MSIACDNTQRSTPNAKQSAIAKKYAYDFLNSKTCPTYTDTLNKKIMPNMLNILKGSFNSIKSARSASFEAGYNKIFG